MSLFFRNKKAKSDFNEENLPSNRKEVFFDCLKIRFTAFLKLGLLLLLFSLPLIVVGLVKDNILYYLEVSYLNGEISDEELSSIYLTTNIIFYIVEIFGYMIFSIGLAGSLRVIRQLVWGEGLFFGQDFFDGIKLNIKHYLLYGFMVGLFNFLSRTVLLSNIQYEILKAIPFGMCLTIFLPPLLYSLVESQIYTLKATQEYKNGFILYIKTLPKTLLATIVILLMLLFELITAFIIKYLVIILFIIFLLPIILLGEFLYFISQLDKYINKEQFPTIYDKGIHRKENKDVRSN